MSSRARSPSGCPLRACSTSPGWPVPSPWSRMDAARSAGESASPHSVCGRVVMICASIGHMTELTDVSGAFGYGDSILVGERVRLRGVRDDDLPTLAKWQMDPGRMATLSSWVAPPSEAAAKPSPWAPRGPGGRRDNGARNGHGSPRRPLESRRSNPSDSCSEAGTGACRSISRPITMIMSLSVSLPYFCQIGANSPLSLGRPGKSLSSLSGTGWPGKRLSSMDAAIRPAAQCPASWGDRGCASTSATGQRTRWLEGHAGVLPATPSQILSGSSSSS